MSKVLVPILEGFEEIELVSIVDILRRGELEVILAGRKKTTLGAHKIAISCDIDLGEISRELLREFSAIALAGGYDGMMNLCNDSFVISALQDLNAQGKLIAAICASPIVLNKAGVLKNRYTCYPSCEDSITSSAKYCKEKVVIDGNIITANGPATAPKFALEILRYLKGDKMHDKIARELLADLD